MPMTALATRRRPGILAQTRGAASDAAETDTPPSDPLRCATILSLHEKRVGSYRRPQRLFPFDMELYSRATEADDQIQAETIG
jgi:hypothetical protein